MEKSIIEVCEESMQDMKDAGLLDDDDNIIDDTNLTIPMEPVEREIVLYPDPILATTCAEVKEDEFDHDLEQLVLDMFYTMKLKEGLGLAANQVGVNKRVIVLSLPNDMILINPIISKSSGTQTVEEGCLSVPQHFANVERSEEIEVVYQNVVGEHQILKATGFKAVCIQHEIDHINGKVFLDHLSKLKQMRMKVKAEKLKKKLTTI